VLDAAKDAYVRLNEEYKALSKEAVALRDQVPRQTMRSDRAEAALEEEKSRVAQEVEKVQAALKGAEDRAEAAEAQAERLKSAFVGAQHEAVRAVADNKRLLVRTDMHACMC